MRHLLFALIFIFCACDSFTPKERYTPNLEGSYIGNRSILRISGDTLLHIADSNTYMYTFYQSGTFIIPNSEKHKLTLTKQSGDTLFLSKVDKGDDDLDWMYYVKIDTTSPEIETIQ